MQHTRYCSTPWTFPFQIKRNTRGQMWKNQEFTRLTCSVIDSDRVMSPHPLNPHVKRPFLCFCQLSWRLWTDLSDKCRNPPGWKRSQLPLSLPRSCISCNILGLTFQPVAGITAQSSSVIRREKHKGNRYSSEFSWCPDLHEETKSYIPKCWIPIFWWKKKKKKRWSLSDVEETVC